MQHICEVTDGTGGTLVLSVLDPKDDLVQEACLIVELQEDQGPSVIVALKDDQWPLVSKAIDDYLLDKEMVNLNVDSETDDQPSKEPA